MFWKKKKYLNPESLRTKSLEYNRIIAEKCLPYVDEKYNIEKHPRYQDYCV